MFKLSLGLALGSALMLAGCGGYRYRVLADGQPVPNNVLRDASAPGAELRGAVVQVASLDGSQTNEIHFRADGSAVLVIANGRRAIDGRWFVRDDRLCLDWPPRGPECWPYRTALQVGQTVDLTSDRNQTVRVTLVSNAGLAPTTN